MTKLYEVSMKMDVEEIMAQMIEFTILQSSVRDSLFGNKKDTIRRDTRKLRFRLGRQNGQSTAVSKLVQRFGHMSPVVVVHKNISKDIFFKSNMILTGKAAEVFTIREFLAASTSDNHRFTTLRHTRLIFVDAADSMTPEDLEEIGNIWLKGTSDDCILFEVG